MRKRPLVLCGFALAAGTWLTAERTVLRPIRISGEPEYRRAVAADSVPHSTQEAEAQGARHPRSSVALSYTPYDSAAAPPGTAERRCVDVGQANVVRSGEIIASPFARYTENWHAGVHPPGKMSWRSGHMRPGAPLQLVVRVARIDTAGPAYVYRGSTRIVRSSYIKPWPYGSLYGAADAFAFDLLRAGTWLFVATLDQDWGCFIFTLK